MTGCGGTEKVHVLHTIDLVERTEHDLYVIMRSNIEDAQDGFCRFGQEGCHFLFGNACPPASRL